MMGSSCRCGRLGWIDVALRCRKGGVGGGGVALRVVLSLFAEVGWIWCDDLDASVDG